MTTVRAGSRTAILATPVLITAHDGRTSTGSADVKRLAPLERLLRSLQALALWLAVAVGAVVVPILHWVLVPSLALTAPVMAFLALRRDRRVVGGAGTCPVCRSPIAFRRTARTDGFSQVCRGCRSTVYVSPLDPRPPAAGSEAAHGGDGPPPAPVAEPGAVGEAGATDREAPR